MDGEIVYEGQGNVPEQEAFVISWLTVALGHLPCFFPTALKSFSKEVGTE